ncbi:hypothetical protein [Exiguobacterium aurantiacum]|uniref:hypothetical protein n=1 Tax=Exiguobacterium aurantiacum TaxID=33987 RepID=UPI001E33F736|nr:hypothetical protein [Exiguobacterium aurantiacum]
MFFQKIQSALISLFIIPFMLPLILPDALGLSLFTTLHPDYMSQKTSFRSKRNG